MADKVDYSAFPEQFRKNFQYIDNQLIDAGYGYNQRLAILGTIQRESQGNPLAVSPNGLWHGLIQWNDGRYRISENNADSELKRQTSLLIEELKKTGWSGNTWEDQISNSDKFRNIDSLYDATHFLTKYFVRPANTDSETEIRFNNAWNARVPQENDYDEKTALKVLPDNLIKKWKRDPKNNHLPSGYTDENGNWHALKAANHESWGEEMRWQRDWKNHEEMDNYLGLDNAVERFPVYKPNPFKFVTKHQSGGLVYKPYLPNNQENIETDYNEYWRNLASNLHSSIHDYDVEQVRIYQPIDITRTEQQVDNTRVAKQPIIETPVSQSKGRVYKSSEKEEFKQTMFNTYYDTLLKRGLDEENARKFAERITSQDILESNWGQSSLARDFNFGGVKDFRKNKDTAVRDTTEYKNGVKQTVKQPFRKFDNLQEYIDYKINLLDNTYHVFNYTPESMFDNLVRGKKKYATDPKYAEKLNNIYNKIW